MKQILAFATCVFAYTAYATEYHFFMMPAIYFFLWTIDFIIND